MDKFKFIDIKNVEDLPKTAGVYVFYAKNTQVTKNLNAKPYTLNPIYIGKAINIKNRVKNHFSSPTYKDNTYINQIEKIGFIDTGNEIQALILEANLIKKHQPKFNQVWRDDKNYFFIAIAKNKLGIPYVFITHQPSLLSLRGGSQADEAIQSNSTNSRLPRSPLGLARNDKTRYIGPFVDGNALKKTMRFLRKIFSYYTTSKHSKLKCTYCHLDLCPGPYFAPLSGASQGKSNLNLVEYKKNIKKLILILEGKSSKVLNSLKKEMTIASKNENFEKAGKIRDQIFALEKVMSHNSFGGIPSSPETFERAQITLQKILNFKKIITKIECYDISNIQGKFAVGSMIVFINGKPDKNQYKKFRIKMKNEPNDIAMLSEVLQRRFTHTEWKYPEIILIDGGTSQLNAGIKSKLQNPNYKQTQNIKIISIAKGRQDPLRQRSEARLFIENQKEPVPLKNLPQEIYNLIKNLDNEAHRFAITYHKKLRKQNLLK